MPITLLKFLSDKLNVQITKLGNNVLTFEYNKTFLIKIIKGNWIALQNLLNSRWQGKSYLTIKVWSSRMLPLQSNKSVTNMPLSNQSFLNIDFLLMRMTLLFHRVEQWGDKLLVNIIFLWKLESLMGILLTSKSHFRRKSKPPNLLYKDLGTWNHIDKPETSTI